MGQVGLWLGSGGRVGKADRSRDPGALFPLDRDGNAVSDFSRIDFTAKAKVACRRVSSGT